MFDRGLAGFRAHSVDPKLEALQSCMQLKEVRVDFGRALTFTAKQRLEDAVEAAWALGYTDLEGNPGSAPELSDLKQLMWPF